MSVKSYFQHNLRWKNRTGGPPSPPSPSGVSVLPSFLLLAGSSSMSEQPEPFIMPAALTLLFAGPSCYHSDLQNPPVSCRSGRVTEGTDVSKPFRAELQQPQPPPPGLSRTLPFHHFLLPYPAGSVADSLSPLNFWVHVWGPTVPRWPLRRTLGS